MDATTAAAAYGGIKQALELGRAVLQMKINHEVETRVAEMLDTLGQTQDRLIQLREELNRLQDENRKLALQLEEKKPIKSAPINTHLSKLPEARWSINRKRNRDTMRALPVVRGKNNFKCFKICTVFPEDFFVQVVRRSLTWHNRPTHPRAVRRADFLTTTRTLGGK